MATSPQWKVYGPDKDYRAACKYVEEAAVLVAFLGDGATIRSDHALVVWTEGHEDQSAAESYDHVAEVVTARVEAHRAKVKANLDARARELAKRHAKRRDAAGEDIGSKLAAGDVDGAYAAAKRWAGS